MSDNFDFYDENLDDLSFSNLANDRHNAIENKAPKLNARYILENLLEEKRLRNELSDYYDHSELEEILNGSSS